MKVYFIQQGTRGPIKIGIARNPKQRLKDLQTANPYELRLLAVLPCQTRKEAERLEKQLHKKFRYLRMRGEWFSQHLVNEMHKVKELNYNHKHYQHLTDEVDDENRSHWFSI